MSEIAKEQAIKDVRILAQRMALLFRCFCEELESELGEEKTEKLVRKVIDKYGTHCGRQVRKHIDALNLPPQGKNYAMGQDLPSVGWETERLAGKSEEVRVRVHYCPLASTWKELGQTKYDRLYCFVDQAKYRAYNAELECTHLLNQLDGHDVCELLIKKKP